MTYARQQTVTRLLKEYQEGREEALDDLFASVYDELYELARGQRRHWHGNNTLNTTALLHEAYLKLTDQTQTNWQSRAHFYATASKAMRHILINYARSRNRKKRGGDRPKISLQDLKITPGAKVDFTEARIDALLTLDDALDRLEEIHPRQTSIVECRFFGGMTIKETAEALDVSPTTVKRGWKTARLWLYREMQEDPA